MSSSELAYDLQLKYQPQSDIHNCHRSNHATLVNANHYLNTAFPRIWFQNVIPLFAVINVTTTPTAVTYTAPVTATATTTAIMTTADNTKLRLLQNTKLVLVHLLKCMCSKY